MSAHTTPSFDTEVHAPAHSAPLEAVYYAPRMRSETLRRDIPTPPEFHAALSAPEDYARHNFLMAVALAHELCHVLRVLVSIQCPGVQHRTCHG
jgi:hypothetical protein